MRGVSRRYRGDSAGNLAGCSGRIRSIRFYFSTVTSLQMPFLRKPPQTQTTPVTSGIWLRRFRSIPREMVVPLDGHPTHAPRNRICTTPRSSTSTNSMSPPSSRTMGRSWSRTSDTRSWSVPSSRCCVVVRARFDMNIASEKKRLLYCAIRATEGPWFLSELAESFKATYLRDGRRIS